jgi:hypothetical protein
MSKWLDSEFIESLERRMADNGAAKDDPSGWPEGGRPRASAAEYAKKVVRHLTRYLILADNGMSDNQVIELISNEAMEAEETMNEVTPEPPNDHLVAVGCNAMCLHRIDRLEGKKVAEPLKNPEQLRQDPMKFWTDNNGVPFCPQCGKARPAHLPKCRDCIVDELVDLLKVPSVVQPVVGTCQTCGAGKVFRAKKCFRCYAEGTWKSIRTAWK